MDQAGINKDKIDKMALEITDLADKINRLFNDFQNLVDDSNNFFKSTTGINFRIKCNNLKDNYSIVKSNILGYVSDLVKAKKVYEKSTDERVSIFNTPSKYL